MTARRFGFVSTYPPTQCGLATFTASLSDAMTASSPDEAVLVRLLEEQDEVRAGSVPGAEMAMGDLRSIAAAAHRLNSCDAVIVQHEFGIYGGHDGADVLRLLGQLRVPTIVVLHTVLTEPSAHQREVLEAVMRAADAVVTMTAMARDRLERGYAVDRTKLRLIAHGARKMAAPVAAPRTALRPAGRRVLTWGLLGPGKGVEWAVEAMALLGDIDPAVHYTIAGQTHPKVVARHGEAYRTQLTESIHRLGLDATVRLDPVYRDPASLALLVASADVVVLPYDSTEQVTSGVLIEAVAAGKPVVATAFPHAVELLGDGTGLLVRHRDPQAIADALRSVFTERGVAAAMSAKASAYTAGLLWPAVAGQYRDLVTDLVRQGVAA